MRQMLRLLIWLLVATSFSASPAVGSQRILMGGQPNFSLRLDFVHDNYVHNGASIWPLSSFTTETRAGLANMDNVAGTWTPFSANVARRSDKGLRAETSRTNRALWDRDLTNVVWVKVNMATPLLDQIGIDGVANSASSICSTGANGTVMQAVVNALTARVQSSFVRRISGTGVINETIDGGLTWTAIPVTNVWSQLKIPTQTLANPGPGLQIVTSGDCIAVDTVQTENNNTGDFATAPIFTTTNAVARNIDLLTLTTLANFADVFQRPQLTVVARFTVYTVIPGGNFFSVSDGTTNNRYTYNFNSFTASDGLSGLTVVGSGVVNGYDPLLKKIDTPGKVYCFVGSTDQVANKVGVTLNGDSKEYTNTSWPSPAGFTTVSFGENLGGGPMYGYLMQVEAAPVYMTPSQRRLACEALGR